MKPRRLSYKSSRRLTSCQEASGGSPEKDLQCVGPEGSERMDIIDTEGTAANALCDLDARNEVAQIERKQQLRAVTNTCDLIALEGTNKRLTIAHDS